jgi:hypothetical protein
MILNFVIDVPAPKNQSKNTDYLNKAAASNSMPNGLRQIALDSLIDSANPGARIHAVQTRLLFTH